MPVKKTIDSTPAPPLLETHVRLVPVEIAEQVAEKFDGDAFTKAGRRTSKPAATKRTIKSREIINDRENIPAFYVFNYTEGGFVIVSADYNHEPIMAYVKGGELTRKEKITVGLGTWMIKTVSNVEMLRQGLHDNTARAEKGWLEYLPEKIVKSSAPSLNISTEPPVRTYVLPPDEPEIPCTQIDVATVGPLIPYHWGQACGYNAQCDPLNTYNCDNPCNSNDPRPLAGCVAVSTAMVMAYWQYPSWYNYSSMATDWPTSASQQLIADVGTWSWMD